MLFYSYIFEVKPLEQNLIIFMILCVCILSPHGEIKFALIIKETLDIKSATMIFFD